MGKGPNVRESGARIYLTISTHAVAEVKNNEALFPKKKRLTQN